MTPRGQTVETSWRLKVSWLLALAQWQKPVGQREENRCHGLAAAQRSKKLLEQDVPIRPHMRRRKSL